MNGRRQRLSKASWESLLAKQSASGLTVARFCAEAGVSVASFYQWRARLGTTTLSEREPEIRASPTFVDLGTLPATGHAFTLRLELGGWVLTLGCR